MLSYDSFAFRISTRHLCLPSFSSSVVIHSPLFAESLAVIIAVLHGSIWYYLLLWRFLVQLAKRAWPGSKVSAFPSGEHSQYSPLYPFNLSIGTSSRFLRAVTKVFLVSNDSVHHFHLIALHLINFALYGLLGWLALHHVHLIKSRNGKKMLEVTTPNTRKTTFFSFCLILM